MGLKDLTPDCLTTVYPSPKTGEGLAAPSKIFYLKDGVPPSLVFERGECPDLSGQGVSSRDILLACNTGRFESSKQEVDWIRVRKHNSIVPDVDLGNEIPKKAFPDDRTPD